MHFFKKGILLGIFLNDFMNWNNSEFITETSNASDLCVFTSQSENKQLSAAAADKLMANAQPVTVHLLLAPVTFYASLNEEGYKRTEQRSSNATVTRELTANTVLSLNNTNTFVIKSNC